jgi:hypothetical protein
MLDGASLGSKFDLTEMEPIISVMYTYVASANSARAIDVASTKINNTELSEAINSMFYRYLVWIQP